MSPEWPGRASPALAVECEDLTFRFGGHTAVENVSLQLRAGETFGLLGPNGAGKTTTIRVLTTLLPAASGHARIFGLDVTGNAMRVRRLLGYVPQMLSADGALTGRENVALFSRLFDVPRRERAARVAEALETMGLTDAADRLARTYSGGMVRRLELAQALVNGPRLLILNEPTIGLDPIARANVWERLEELRSTTGMTVLLTTHYLEEAERLCERVALLHRARLGAVGRPGELQAALGPEATLDDVFRHYTGEGLEEGGDLRDVRRTRRTARRLG